MSSCYICHKTGCDEIEPDGRSVHSECKTGPVEEPVLPPALLAAHKRLKDAIRIQDASKEALKAAREEFETASAEVSRLLDEFSSGQKNFLDEVQG